MNKKLLIGLASTFAIAPVAVSAGCNKDQFFKEEQMKDANGTPVEGRKTISTLASITSDPAFKVGENQKNFRTVYISGEGSIEDKSFNQSGWEAVHKLSYELGLDIAQSKGNKNLFNSYRQPASDRFVEAYTEVIEKGIYKYVVVCGYTLSAPLETVFKDAKLLRKIKDQNMLFICVDFTPESSDPAVAKELKDYTIAVEYDIAAAGYMAGYALSNYLSEKYPTEAAKRTLGAFGGYKWPSVSDFIIGAFKGVEDANKTHLDKTTRSIKDLVNLDSGFEAGSPNAFAAIDDIKDAQAWYPVAGSITTQAAKKLTKDQFLIGVDADQAKALTNTRIFTSVMKQIGQAIYNILGNLYTYGDVSRIPELAKWKDTKTAEFFGYSVEHPGQRYVDIAEASLIDENNTKIAQKWLDQAKNYYHENHVAIQTEIKGLKQRFAKNGDVSEPQIYQTITDGLAKAINSQK
ncbi:BMP family ABC transporter substrate-binding protein [Mycoplasmopsis felifaucium]|uniref:BMP family ABC transporter substrate-binding protein n=1 Tax=Mycoplasmopsis felifaucium TaxID=35768 RepID=UPI00068F63D4|nr:BMP family ABC transporter substrate-binding protein [Mycoplasmopsis felifaucium]